MTDPVLIKTERHSDTTNFLYMSDDSTLFGCTWPGCNYVSPNMGSIPSHYKTHVGQAAQRRRAQRRPRSAEVTNELLEAALATLDMVQILVDRVDSFDAEYTNMARLLEEARVTIEELTQGDEDLRRKAAAYDSIQEAIRLASS
jgi:hypothetical protein